MNQFKKAKQIAQEAGKKTESITDLKTAGVTGTPSENSRSEMEVAIPTAEITIATTQKTHDNRIKETTPETIPLSEITSDIIIPDVKSKQTFMQETPLEQSVSLANPNDNLPSIPQAVIQQQVVPEVDTYTPKTAPSKGTVGKKSVPNIFAPKGEAKSMRKSLVLKPTSVKIAENYCAKNGGSFNELIQTLLDNFIEEYGL